MIKVLTLFGEEIIPEELNVVPKKRAQQKAAETPEVKEVPAAAIEIKKEEKKKGALERARNEIKPAKEKEVEVASSLTQPVNEPAAAAQENLPVDETPKVLRKKRPIKKARGKNIIPNLSEPEILKRWAAEKQYYPIGEVADLFNVATSHIRYWTNEFGIRVRTTKKGDRMYSGDHIQTLRLIYHLTKERGFTLAGAKTKLKENKKPTTQSLDLNHSLLQLRKQLLEIRNQLV